MAAVRGDVDGNGFANAVVTSSQTGQSFWRYDSGPSSEMADAVTLGSASDYPFLADMDGNGREQLGVFRPAGNEFWYKQDFKAGSSGYVGSALALGGPGDFPLVTDVDNNGTSQVAVYRPSTGYFEWRSDASPGSYSGSYGYFGDPGVPMLGDVDGNGHANPVLFNRWNGTWRWTDDYGPGGVTGTAGKHTSYIGGSLGGDDSDDFDVPLLGDVDGNGRANMVIYRPTNGTFYWLADGGLNSPGRPEGWKIPAWSADRWAEYIPLLLDFDGNGRENVAVYRQRDGIFTWNSDFGPNTFNGYIHLGTGANNDIPTASTWQARQASMYLTSWRYGGGDGIVNTSPEAEVVAVAIRGASQDSYSADIVGKLSPADREYVEEWMRPRWPTALAHGGANWKIDKDAEADKAIETHRALDHAQASTAPWGIWGMTSAETNFVVARIDATNPASRAYGGPNWKVDTDGEAEAVVNAFVSAGSDGAANELYQRLAPADRPAVDARLRSAVIAIDVLRVVSTGAWYYIGEDGYAFWVESAQAASAAGISLSAPKRVTAAVVATYPAGDPVTEFDLNAPGEAFAADEAERAAADSGYKKVGYEDFDITTSEGEDKVRASGRVNVYRGKGKKELIRRFEFGAGSKVYAQKALQCMHVQIAATWASVSGGWASIGAGGATYQDGWNTRCKAGGNATRPTYISLYGAGYAKRLLNSLSLDIRHGNDITDRRWPTFKKMSWSTVTPVN